MRIQESPSARSDRNRQLGGKSFRARPDRDADICDLRRLNDPLAGRKRSAYHPCPQMTQITQIKTRASCDVICVNLRDLRVNGWSAEGASRFRAQIQKNCLQTVPNGCADE